MKKKKTDSILEFPLKGLRSDSKSPHCAPFNTKLTTRAGLLSPAAAWIRPAAAAAAE